MWNGPSPRQYSFAAFAGSVDTDRVRAHLDTFDPAPLLRFFDEADRAGLADRLPPLLSDDLARELALRLLIRLDRSRRDAIVTSLIADAPTRIEAALGAIWRECVDMMQDDGSIPKLVRSMQQRFDDVWPNRVAAAIEQADAMVDATAAAVDLADLEQCLTLLDSIARSRPFDTAIRLSEAQGAVNAIIDYGRAGLHGSGRHFSWKRRLAHVAQAFPAHAAIQEHAKKHDLTYFEQSRRNFQPYGRYDRS